MQEADRGIERLAVQVAPWACGRDSSQDDAERTRATRGGVWRPGRAGDAGPGSVDSRASLPRAVWRAVAHGSGSVDAARGPERPAEGMLYD